MPDRERRAHGAAALAALGGVLGVVTVALSLLSAGLPALRDVAAIDEVLSVLGLLPSLAFCAVGGVIATRRHGNRIGLLSLAIGLLFVVVMTFGAAGLLAAKRGASAGTVGWLWWPAALWAPALGLLATHLVLRLPDGTLRSPRWRPFSWLCTAAVGLFSVVTATEPTTYAPQSVDVTRNPLALPALAPLVPLAYGLIVVCCLAALASLVLRYRSADPQRLMQIRWIAFGAVIAIASVPLIAVDAVLRAPLSQALVAARFAVTFLALTAIPVTIGVAVLRYRLYDIDRVISRTLSYAVLTVLLAGAYGATVTVLGNLLSPLTGSSQLAVAGSTLAIAALFGPARSRCRRPSTAGSTVPATTPARSSRRSRPVARGGRPRRAVRRAARRGARDRPAGARLLMVALGRHARGDQPRTSQRVSRPSGPTSRPRSSTAAMRERRPRPRAPRRTQS